MSELAGHVLDDRDGNEIGRIDEVLAGDGGKADWLVVRVRRFGQRVVVPGADAVAAVGRVWVPYDAEQIRGAPKVDGSGGLTADDERALSAHFGIGADAVGQA